MALIIVNDQSLKEAGATGSSKDFHYALPACRSHRSRVKELQDSLPRAWCRSPRSLAGWRGLSLRPPFHSGVPFHDFEKVGTRDQVLENHEVVAGFLLFKHGVGREADGGDAGLA